MSPESVAVLAIVQGLTEFLPISSSAHLILAPVLLGWPDQGLAFDVAVHVGSLAAVVIYFRAELRKLGVDWFHSVAQRQLVGESALAWGVLIGTVPVGLAALLAGELIELYLRSPLVIAGATLGFGALLWLVHAWSRQERTEGTLTFRDCLLIGCAQALALIPGTSRAGITITAGLALGLTASAATRYSFLLSVPTIALAGGSKAVALAGTSVDLGPMAFGAIIAGVSAYACIHWFLKILSAVGMMPFIIYRLVLGAALLGFFW